MQGNACRVSLGLLSLWKALHDFVCSIHPFLPPFPYRHPDQYQQLGPAPLKPYQLAAAAAKATAAAATEAALSAAAASYVAESGSAAGGAGDAGVAGEGDET